MIDGTSTIVRFLSDDEVGVGVLAGGRIQRLEIASIGALLRLSLDEARHLVAAPPGDSLDAGHCRLLAPVDEQEVWAAGVTYLRSRDARLEESGGADAYSRVYQADRPELFFKSPGWRVVGPDEAIGIRRDSTWSLPEPELAVVVNSRQEIVGYTVGNDVSSRSIEGENALYLPQAKVYERSCALGPGIVPAWDIPDPIEAAIELEVVRGSSVVTRASSTLGNMKRSIPELLDWLHRAIAFPHGVVLLTGTGAVPPSDFTLQADDRVVIEITGVGRLCNPVVEVGR